MPSWRSWGIFNSEVSSSSMDSPAFLIISGGTIPHSYAVVLAITDGLFALSTEATVGQNLGIYTAVLRFRLRERSTRSMDAEFRSS